MENNNIIAIPNTDDDASDPTKIIDQSSVWIWLSVVIIVLLAIAVVVILVWYFDSHHQSSSSSPPSTTSTTTTSTSSNPITIISPINDSSYAFQENFDGSWLKNWNIVTDGSGDYDNECQFYVPENVVAASTGIALVVNPIVNSQGTNVTTLANYRYTNPVDNTISQRYYVGGKINTLNHFAFQYGRVDVTMQTPAPFSPFMCPAISLVPIKQLESSISAWPLLGQIDLMNIFGLVYDDQYIGSTVWYGGPNSSAYSVVKNQFHMTSTPNNVHMFSVLWQPAALSFFCDDFLYATVTPNNIMNNGISNPNLNRDKWPFDMTNNFCCLSIKNGIGGSNSCSPGTNVPPLDQNTSSINPLVGNYLSQPTQQVIVMSVTVTPTSFTVLSSPKK